MTIYVIVCFVMTIYAIVCLPLSVFITKQCVASNRYSLLWQLLSHKNYGHIVIEAKKANNSLLLDEIRNYDITSIFMEYKSL